MKRLNKESKNYLVTLIKEKESVNSIKSFCEGLGFDTSNYSSPVHIAGDKVTIRYRTENTYYNI